MTTNLMFLVLMIGVFYFMIIRPQKNKQSKYRQMLEALTVGDNIVTIEGIHGKVVKIDSDKIAILTGKANKTRLVMSKTAIDHIKK
ncbi:preprotein translocase subunit YajC [Clostridium cylindrosporum]|uniref:Preprotein translocase, YajC subunit n=1 Tax=Clostridium cylindrosporum DSM 605 TaxID=1121307 RepID=A0A0J8DAC2_CLOCY|nr:preprotein translocase subunit YajC [Clostridium cylindrosporum]KMT21264.1 preprotein translocase, YajC subunit [Clostridium cylindrosporum DSM 605]